MNTPKIVERNLDDVPSASWDLVRRRLRDYPVLLRIVIAVSVVVSPLIALAGVVSAWNLDEVILPLFGGPVTPLLSFLAAWKLLFPKGPLPHSQIKAVYALLLLGILFAGIDLWRGVRLIDHTNPYLRFSPWRPLWTLGMPSLFLLAVGLPSARVALRKQEAA